MSFESPDSSSPMVTRAVAAGLQDLYIDNYQIPKWQKAALLILSTLPQSIGRFVISRFQSVSGLRPKTMANFSINQLIQERLNDYVQLNGTFPVITIGAALGGATTYLSLALKGLFLPQAFIVTLKGGSKDGEVRQYLNRSLEIALRISNENPGLITIQHYDPIHDGWLTRFVNHLRIKLLDLPKAYEEFIKRKLEPGGAVVYLESGAQWLRYRLGSRCVFQVGGWGDISAQEFLKGSESISQYARRAGLKYDRWQLTDYELEYGPESEWGSEPGLAEALEEFCSREGYRFKRLYLPHPNDFSKLTFFTAQRLLEKEGRPPAGVLVEMFSQFDSTAARLAGLLPLWLIYNTKDSLDFLKSMRLRFPTGKPIFFSPLTTFSLTPDLVNWQEWENAFEGLEWTNIGARKSHYPSDVRALVKWVDPLRKWVEENRKQIYAGLEVEELVQLAQLIIN